MQYRTRVNREVDKRNRLLVVAERVYWFPIVVKTHIRTDTQNGLMWMHSYVEVGIDKSRI